MHLHPTSTWLNGVSGLWRGDLHLLPRPPSENNLLILLWVKTSNLSLRRLLPPLLLCCKEIVFHGLPLRQLELLLLNYFLLLCNGGLRVLSIHGLESILVQFYFMGVVLLPRQKQFILLLQALVSPFLPALILFFHFFYAICVPKRI